MVSAAVMMVTQVVAAVVQGSGAVKEHKSHERGSWSHELSLFSEHTTPLRKWPAVTSCVASLQGAMLMVIGPLIDQAITKQWVLDYAWTKPAAQQLLVSCALAVLVNISQFMCLGRFSAVSFQVGSSVLMVCVPKSPPS